MCVSACALQESPDFERGQEAIAAVPGECYLVGDSDNRLSIVVRNDVDPSTNETDIGQTGVNNIEALAVSPLTKIVYAADAGQLGTLNVDTGAFTALPRVFGTGSGADNNQALNDVDGLASDPCTGEFYASHWRGGNEDLLFKIDIETGTHIPDAFGLGIDYVVIPAIAGLEDVDDIAIDPDDCQLYGIFNNGGSDDRLGRIDKNSGVSTDVGPFGISDLEGMSFAPDGSMYATGGINAAVVGHRTCLSGPQSARRRASGHARSVGQSGDQYELATGALSKRRYLGRRHDHEFSCRGIHW